MGIPLAPLAVKEPPSLLETYGRIIGLQNMVQQGQGEKLQQQLLGSQLQDDMAGRAMMNELAQRSTSTGKAPTPDDVYALAGKYGASATAANAIANGLLTTRQHMSEIAKNDAATNASNLETVQKRQDELRGRIMSIINGPQADKQQNWAKEISSEEQSGQIQPGAFSNVYPGDEAAQAFADHFALGSTLAKEANEKMSATGSYLRGVTAANEFAAKQNPQSSFYAPSPASVALGTAPGAQTIQANEALQAGRKSAAEAAARQPFELGLAKARQSIQDGDPKAAGQLLASGDVSPSQIISARKPEFAQQAFQAAHDLSSGQWNAQKAEADFKVASSPANLAFFGSAKSLTDTGGTLDQLADAAKDIPQNQIPVFNTIADAVKASTGSGAVAKYASIALGVADDYSKVMGGGQGSDASRTQAIQLISAKQSPAQRAASIEGIRGAVDSQKNSRIGTNAVLQRMYGGSTTSANTPKGAQGVGHIIQIGNDKYQYKGTGDTADLNSYTRLP